MCTIKKLIYSYFVIVFSFFAFNAHAQLVITATGGANAFNVTYPANISSLSSGLSITFLSNQTITGPTTLNLNAIGTRPIVKNGSLPLVAGDIVNNQMVTVVYDGTNYQLLSPTANSASSQWTTTTGGAIFYSGGNVGIGTSAVASALTLAPTSLIGWQYSSGFSNANHFIGKAAQGASPLLFYTTYNPGPTAPIFQFQQNNGSVNDILTLLYNGNVGIGTSTPGNNLHINGGARVSNLSISGPVFANNLGDLYISTANSNLWTVLGTNLQPLNNTHSINLATTFGGYFINGNRIVSSNAANVVFLGNSGSSQNAGGNNLFYGALAGSSNTTGNSNIFLGFQSGAANLTGTQNVYIGEFTGLNATGSNNLFIGQNAGKGTTSAFNNIFFGQNAGQNNLTGGANIIIGALADVGLPTLSNAIAIGMNATVEGSNMMALGGIGANAVKVGIGTGLPQNDLHVVGGARISNLSTSGAVFANTNGDLFVSTSSGANAWTISGTNIFPQNLLSNVGIGLGSISTPGMVAGASRYLTLAANQTNTFGYPSFEMLSVNTSTLNSPMSRLDFINVITPFATRSNHARIAAFTGKSVLGNGQLGFYTSNGTLNEVMRITENGGVAIGSAYTPLVTPISGLIVQGNVGIGSTTPGNNLDVNGGVRVSSLASSGPVFANTSGDLYINTATGISGSGTSGGVAFWNTNNTLTADGANFYWNNTNKRLGIGNTNPQVKLHLSAENTGNNLNLLLESSESGAAQGPGISMLRAKGTLAAPTAVVLDDYLGGVAANGRTASQFNMSSNINFEVDAAVSGNSVPGRIVFSTTSSTGTLPSERMRINSLGNIGVGITTPLARMHLKSLGTTTATSAFTIQNSVNTLLFNIKDNGLVGVATGTPVARLHVRGLGTTTATDAIIVENTSGTVIFDIQDDGSVGIGTGAPVAPLQVIGDSRFFGSKASPLYSVNLFSNSGSGPRIGFSDVSASLNTFMEIGAYGGDNNIDNKARDFRIYSNATSATGFNILAANGNVGIETLTPYSTLHVNGSNQYKLTVANSNYTIADNDAIVVKQTATAFTYTLPAPSANLIGRTYQLLNTAATATITITAASGSITGSTTVPISSGRTCICATAVTWHCY